MGSKPPWTIEVDHAVCIGSGLCLVYAAATFDHDDSAHAVVIDPGGDTLDAIRVAVDACPTGAITLHMHGAPPGDSSTDGTADDDHAHIDRHGG